MSPELISSRALGEIPLFADLSPNHLEILTTIATLRTAHDGEELFHEGDPQDDIYIVLEGRVALEIHVPNRGRLRILTVEPMEVLGWSSVTDASPRRTASARAVAPTRLLAIDSSQLRRECLADCELGSVIMRHVANVIANRLMVTRLQLLDLFASQPPEVHHG